MLNLPQTFYSEIEQSYDSSMFDNIQQEISSDCNEDNRDIESCTKINRLICALKYYKSFNMDIEASNNDGNFTHFANNVYNHASLIQDIYHLMKKHDAQIYDIRKLITNHHNDDICDINTCSASSRHYRTENDIRLLSDDPKMNVYCDSLDSLHVYLIHSHQIGMRIAQKTIENDDGFNGDNKESDNDNSCYDHEFARYKDIISGTIDVTNRFERISSNNNKYKINQISDETIFDETDDETYLDSLIDHLYHENISEDIILKLIAYLKKEQYDTETVDIDLSLSNVGGNINKYMNNKECMKSVMNMFTKSKSYAFFDHIAIVCL